MVGCRSWLQLRSRVRQWPRCLTCLYAQRTQMSAFKPFLFSSRWQIYWVSCAPLWMDHIDMHSVGHSALIHSDQWGGRLSLCLPWRRSLRCFCLLQIHLCCMWGCMVRFASKAQSLTICFDPVFSKHTSGFTSRTHLASLGKNWPCYRTLRMLSCANSPMVNFRNSNCE